MALDDPVPPVSPVSSEPVEASVDVPTPSPVTGAAAARPAAPPPPPAAAAATPPPGELTLGEELQESELRAPIASPTAVDERTTVHDAALHGGRLARAIEQASASEHPAPAPGTRPEVNDRAQQLGGSMASAASGQATPRPEAPDVEDAVDDHVDPLAPVARIEEDSHRRDQRHREERDAR